MKIANFSIQYKCRKSKKYKKKYILHFCNKFKKTYGNFKCKDLKTRGRFWKKKQAK